MPITPYVRPQETITQILRMTPPPLVSRRNPLVIGPEYLLGNFDADNRYEHAFESTADTLDYTYLDEEGIAVTVDPTNYEVDTASVQLICEDLEVRVSHQSNEVSALRGALSTVLVQSSSVVYFTGPVGDLAANLNDRPLRVGDVLYVTAADENTYRRTIVGFSTTPDGKATSILVNGVIPGDAEDAVTFFVTSRVTATLDEDFLTDLSRANIVASATEVEYDGLVFKKAVFGVPSTGTDCNAVAPTGSAGRLSVYFRALRIVGALEGVVTINSLSDLASLGTLHIDNPIAYGAYQAFKGNQSSKTYALRTNGETLEDFIEALDKIRSTDYYYALAPMTNDEQAKEAVAAHCEEMSNKFNRNFRRCYLGYDSPGSFMVWGIKETGDLRIATVDATNKRIIIDDDDQSTSNFLTDLSIGDTVTLGVTMTDGAIDEGSGDAVIISRIISASEAEYTGTASGGVSVALTATRADSSANVVKYFQERNIGSRRAAIVWSDNPVTFSTASTSTLATGITASYNSRRVPLMYVAAEVAGLRCALLPQQGLTMTELKSIDTAPGMYTRFTPEQLDVIASNGVFIATQEIEGGEIFVRHQLTSKTDGGALAYEDNIGVIVDDFSYRVKDEFRQYLGRRNVTRETMDEIAAKLKDLAIEATQETLANREIGPMVIRFFDENDKEGSVTVRVDGNLADHIVTYVRLRVPLPINGLDHFVDVETSVDL
jgi:hypothetical protein